MGVPQGTVSGPLPFVICIKGITYLLNPGKIACLDDIYLLYKGNNCSETFKNGERRINKLKLWVDELVV